MASNEIVEARILFSGVKAVATGPVQSQVRRIKQFETDISGSGQATVVFEGSQAGREWDALFTAELSTTGTASLTAYHDGPWAAIRARVTAVTGDVTINAAMGF